MSERIEVREMVINALSDVLQQMKDGATCASTRVARDMQGCYDVAVTLDRAALPPFTPEVFGRMPGSCFFPDQQAIRCSERMPKPEQRVLAFVPSQPEGRCWRVAQWCAPPAQYTDESWRDEESMVGDEAYRWQPDQVTHWMPMPGDPS